MVIKAPAKALANACVFIMVVASPSSFVVTSRRRDALDDPSARRPARL